MTLISKEAETPATSPTVEAGDAVKERPILFSAPMVKALLAGEKTQTRRLAKCSGYDLGAFAFTHLYDQPNNILQASFETLAPRDDGIRWVSFACPYGKPGDRLWVRETWGMNHYQLEQGPIPKARPADFNEPDNNYLVYRATEDDAEVLNELRWWPSIHMPRWASRILLEVVSVRVERLHEITKEDALAEGVRCDGLGELVWSGFMGVPRATCPPITSFAVLWSEINGDASWSANPWVWVVEFKQIDAPAALQQEDSSHGE